jgi:hypothetical protein
MYNTTVNRKSALGWKYFLDQARRMLMEETDHERKKDLRIAVKGFEILIKRRAPLPKGLRKIAEMEQESIPA